jgi:murein DD-endopeptidase MepM/ murein hydrolase activator NlpD
MSARGWLAFVVAVLVVAGGAWIWTRWEGAAPEIIAPAEIVVGSGGRSVAIDLSDRGSGLRQVTVVLTHALGEEPLASESWPGGALKGAARGEEPARLEVEIDPGGLPRQVEEGILRISTRDWSWRDGLRGNETQLAVPVRIDRKPPRIAVATGLTYVRRGGAGLVVYALAEPVVRDGVQVGEVFFPGFPLGERRVAVYAIPTDAPPGAEIRVVAEDVAGNVGKARWPVMLKERRLPEADVKLPASFLEDTVGPMARAEGIQAADPKEAFRRINTELRDANEKRIRELLADGAADRLWEGAFQQLPNSKVTSRFAEQRTYYVGGEANSEAVHFGYDLASTAAAPVTAAAAGQVVFAEELGIYGNCVLIDHGLGVASLYGHLSRLDVAPGDRVEKGGQLGLSGATGLAGGDHLHFAILVGGVYVDPIEWWDPKWVRDNVEARLAPPGP